MLSSVFPTPSPTTWSWLLLRVWHEPFSFSCAHMYTYIILPLKKIKLGYHTHLSIKAYCGNQPPRQPPEMAGFLIFTLLLTPPTLYNSQSECPVECSRGDGITPEISVQKTEASILNFLFLLYHPVWRKARCHVVGTLSQPVQGSTVSI